MHETNCPLSGEGGVVLKMTMREGPETKNVFVKPEQYEQVEDTKAVIRSRK